MRPDASAASSGGASASAAAGTSGSAYDLPPGAESVITQVTSLEIQAPSTSHAAVLAHQQQLQQQQQQQQERRRRRRHRRHRTASSSSSRLRKGPLQRFLDALRSTLCFCFPSAHDEGDEDEDGGGGESERRRRRGGGGNSRASASAASGPSRSPGSTTSSAAGSAASVGSAGSELLFLPPAPPPAPPFEGPPVIGPRSSSDASTGKKTLVLDLDETLVHSSFRPVPNADFVIPVEIDGRCVDVYVLKRPHVDEFLAQVGPRFEVVVFTASLAKYADPLLDLLDARTGAFRWRLFRDACVAFEGNYVKDLQCLGRPLSDSIIVDNSPHSYVFQPDNAVPVSTFIDDPADTELLQILPLLLAVERVPDVRPHLAHHVARLAEAQASRGREGG